MSRINPNTPDRMLDEEEKKHGYRKLYLCGKIGFGKFSIIDNEDYQEACQYRWHLRSDGKHVVAEICGKKVALHRFITKDYVSRDIDHIDGDGFNNCKSNLRGATRSQNNANQRKSDRPLTSRFKGVSYDKRRNRWIATIRVNYKNTHIGSFTDEIDAAMAYDAYARRYFREFARLNFPDVSLSEEEIEQRKVTRNSSSKYKGVFWSKSIRRWAVYVLYNGKRMYLGSYDTELKAAIARDKYIRGLADCRLVLNFPDIVYDDLDALVNSTCG
jgi:hypothetical protein